MNRDPLQVSQEVIARIARQFPNLEMEQCPDDPVDMSVILPVQSGLKHRVWLGLQNDDELCFGVGALQGHWFPCTEQSKVDAYCETVVGFLSGSFRVLEHYRGSRCVKSQLQRLDGEAWKAVYTHGHLSWPFPWKKSYRILSNA